VRIALFDVSPGKARRRVKDGHFDKEVAPLQAAGCRASVDASARESKAGARMEAIKVQLTQDDIDWILEVRRQRSKVFGEGLFSDPAWDILLELFAAKLAGRRMTLRELGGVAPESTLARWVAALEERGLVACEVNPLDPDQFRIRLSSRSEDKMMRFLKATRNGRRC
jgi:hypothetical protein